MYNNLCPRLGGDTEAWAFLFLGRKLAPVGDGREVDQGFDLRQRPPLGANVASTAAIATVV